MTVDAVLGCRETNIHVQPKKRFFPSKIPILHYQLRHLITSPFEGLVYFVNLRDVYCIDTTTNKRSPVTELPFEAFCTATGYGWFCAGGRDSGYFAFFRLPEASAARPSSDASLADGPVSDLLNSTRDIFDRPGWPTSRATSPRVRIEKLGDEILNSISIHKIRGPSADEDDVVAILTNNDRTVRMYSLTNDVELRVEHFDFPMNHATISPDGRILMIVGDREWAYFYDCQGNQSQSKNKTNNADSRYEPQHTSSKWTLIQKLKLYRPPRADSAAYFTTAWSQSGKLCATASDNGFITVFDTEVLWNPENNPVAAIVPSSRPNTEDGAVRAMAFAPEPWDLLIWTEHCSRVAIGDLRNGLASRQVIDLDPKSEDITKIDLIDTSHLFSNTDMDFAYESLLNRNQPEASRTTDENSPLFLQQDSLAGSRERRRLRLRAAGVPDLGNELHSLTQAERHILNGLRATSQRQNALMDLNTIRGITSRTESNPRDDRNSPHQSLPPPRSPYTPQSPQTPSSDNQLASDRVWNDVRLGPHGNAIFREAAVLGSIRDYIRDQGRDNTSGNNRRDNNNGGGSSSNQQNQPHRRGSVVLSSTYPASSESTMVDNLAESESSSSDPWQIISSALRRASSSLASSNARAISTLDNTGDGNATTSDNRHYDDLLPPLFVNDPTSRENANSLNFGLSGMRERILDNEMRGAIRNSRPRLFLRNTNQSNDSSRGAADGNTANRTTLRERDWRGDGDANHYEPPFYARATLGPITSAGIRYPYGEGAEDFPNDPRKNTGSTGIAFSDEGRTLFVGTHEGIFEMKMNFQERKFWPAITPR